MPPYSPKLARTAKFLKRILLNLENCSSSDEEIALI